MTRMDTNVAVRTDLVFKEEVYQIIGAAMEIHNVLGAGFAEAVYQEVMELELSARGIPFERQKILRIQYKGVTLQKEYCADLIAFAKVLIEIKAQRELKSRDEAQLINYLKATGLRVGVLINFGDPGRLDWHRFVL